MILWQQGFVFIWLTYLRSVYILFGIKSLLCNLSPLFCELRNTRKDLLFFFNKILIIHNLLLHKIVFLHSWKGRQLTGHKILPLGKGDVCLLVSFPYEYLLLPLPFTIKFTLLKSMENEVKSLEQKLHGGISKQWKASGSWEKHLQSLTS